MAERGASEIARMNKAGKATLADVFEGETALMAMAKIQDRPASKKYN